MILDIYFKRPIFWDYLIGSITVLVLTILFRDEKLSLPSTQDSYSLTGDLTNISLTLIGFILTILTVLITFKDNSNIKVANEDDPVFTKFFATSYYFETVRHLKNCIKSLTIITTFGFFLKLSLTIELRKLLFFYNVLGLIIVMLTVYRCLLILSKTLELQRTK
jgi:hypothetical protein